MAAFSYSSHQDIFDVDVADFPDGSNLPPLLPPPQQHQQQHPQAGGTFVASSGFPAIFYHPSDCHSVIRAEMTAANSTATATPASSSSLENARIASPFPFAQRAESPLERKRKDDQKCNTISSQLKITKQKKCSGDTEKGREKRALEEPHTEYIHVKARRGQATDSHSLAERVRREKIRDRMKMLQGLIPGCDKVIGKALLLDEIINYVQSLQNQVEFLSMKLTSLNPRLYEFGLNSEGFLISPEKLEEMSLELPYIQQKYPHPAIAFTDTADSCPIQDSPPAFQLHGEDRAAFPQDNGDSSAVQFDYNRESLLNQVDFSSVPSSFR